MRLKLSIWLCILSWCCECTMHEVLQFKKRHPPSEGDNPLSVNIGMYIESLGDFKSTEMSFDVDIYMYLSWRDARLAHNFSDYVLINDEKMRAKMWTPDLYFANARRAQFQDVTVPNFSMFIAGDGTVSYSLRCTLTVACSLDLRFYPMDNQLCSIRILSYAYIAKQVNVTWFGETPIRHNPDIGLPEFHIENVSSGYCNGNYRYAIMPNSYKQDNFSCLAGNIYLARSIGYNLVQSYIPTGLIVMISWVSFWIDRRAVPARVTLSFTTLVSLTTLGNGLRFGLPQVSYAKAIDLWYGVCMLFVFCALLEFAIINSYMRKSEKFDFMSKRMTSHRGNLSEFKVHHESESPLYADSPESETKNINEELKPLNGQVKCNGHNGKNGHNGHHANVKADGGELITMNIRYIDDPSPGRPLLISKRGSRMRLPLSLLEESFHSSENTPVKTARPSTGREPSLYENLTPNRWQRAKEIFFDDSKLDEDEHSFMELPIPNVLYKGADGVPVSDRSTASKYTLMSRQFSRTALHIDVLCRYGFPLIFGLWNCWYWWYYLIFTRKSVAERELGSH